MSVEFETALYIKLGEKGKWEKSSIDEAKIRISWARIALQDIQKKKWDKIRKLIEGYAKTKGSASNDFGALKKIAEADSRTLFITFYGGRLYWCKPAMTDPLVDEDHTSMFRVVDGKWDCKNESGEILDLEKVPGKISMLQRYSGTCCTVHEIESLKRLLNGLQSDQYKKIDDARKKLISVVQEGIKVLHPKEFELMVELIFRQSGWRRISILGESIKDIDLELEDPITHDKYMVQVKSVSDQKEFDKYATKYEQLYKDKFRKFYYVVHDIKGPQLKTNNDNIEIIRSNKLAEMVVSLGLLDWLTNKII